MIGIYKITNTINGKCYIGQSKNISIRWKTHTQNIKKTSSESVIRMAFAKYNLREQVGKPGKYGDFIFEILEECEEDELLIRERYYIQKLKPEYNIALVGPTQYFLPSKQKKANVFIQYHSFLQRGYFPNYTGESDDNKTTFELDSGIYSKKPFCKNMLGSKVILILGAKPGEAKSTIYYLWSETMVESIEFDAEEKRYLIYGIERLLEYPIILNKIIGFNDFRKKCGNFAYGLQSIGDYDFYNNQIRKLICSSIQKVPRNYKEYLVAFCDAENDKYS